MPDFNDASHAKAVPTEEERALQEQILKIDHAVEAIWVNAVAFGRMIPMETHEVGRLCVQAGIRYLEKLVESYHRRKTGAAQGGLTFSLEERTRRQQEIKAQALDLERSLLEAVNACRQLHGQMNVDDGQPAESTGEAPPTVN